MSTLRAFSNNKRVSTGRVMKNGSFFQAYPNHQVFTTQDDWMNHWKTKCNVTFVEEGYEDMPPLIPASTSRTAAREKQCGVCNETIGLDHRMCLVEMLRNGVTDVVNEWHRRSGFDVPTSTAPAPPTSSPTPPTSSPTPLPTTPPSAPTPTSPPHLSRKASTKPNKNDWNYTEKHSYIAPPGTYYIGDICYFLQEPIYDGIFGNESYESGLYMRKSDNAFFMVDGTAYGDGLYKGSDGFEYGVDAGIIGIVSRALGPETDDKVYGGKLYTFKEPVEIKFKGGLFRFKSHSKYLVIDTAGSTYNSDEDW